MKMEGLYFDLVNASNSKTTDDEKQQKPRKLRSMLSRRMSSVKDPSLVGSSDEEEEEEDEEEEVEHEDKEVYPVSLMRLLKMNSPEWPYILFGCLAAIVVGGTMPAFAILFGEFYGVS